MGSLLPTCDLSWMLPEDKVAEHKRIPAEECPYRIRCLICQKFTITIWENPESNGFSAFLKELPELIKQFEFVTCRTIKCSTCQKKDIIDDMFHCSRCDVEICGTCAYRMHRDHQATILTTEKGKIIAKEVNEGTSKQVQTYRNSFPVLHSEVIEMIGEFGKKLSKAAKNIASIDKYEKIEEREKECKQFGEDFKQSAEKYLLSLHSFDTDLKELVAKLNVVKVECDEGMDENDGF